MELLTISTPSFSQTGSKNSISVENIKSIRMESNVSLEYLNGLLPVLGAMLIYLDLMFDQKEADFPTDKIASAPSSPWVIIMLIVSLSKATLNKATSSIMPLTGYANPGQSSIFNGPGLKSGFPSNGASASTTPSTYDLTDFMSYVPAR